jgi:hypothetical protein
MSAQAVYAKIENHFYSVTDPETLELLENHEQMVETALASRSRADRALVGTYLGWATSFFAFMCCHLPPCPTFALPFICAPALYCEEVESTNWRNQANKTADLYKRMIIQGSQSVDNIPAGSRVIEMIEVSEFSTNQRPIGQSYKGTV